MTTTIHEYLDDMHLAVPWTEAEASNGEDEKILFMAFRELKRHIHEYATLTVPFANRISLKDYKVKEFLEIRRAQTPANLGSYTTGGSIFSSLAGMIPFSGASTSSSILDSYVNYYTEAMLIQSIKNTISRDLAYQWDEQNELLYLSANAPHPDYVTITYIPRYESPDDIKTAYWQDWMRRLAIAHFKIYVGQKRSKMSISSSPVQLNGETILSEGREELAEIRQYLSENNNTVKIR